MNPPSSQIKSRIERELVKGIVHLSRHKEFYGHIVQQLQKVFVTAEHTIKTAGVGRIPGERFIKMYLNLDFFESILGDDRNKHSWDSMLSVLEHEILHIIFGHLFLRFQDVTRGNVAVDLVVNSILQKDLLPGEYVHPEQYGFPPDKSAMWYYTHLKDNERYKQQCASGQFGLGGLLSHCMSSHGLWEDVRDDMVAKEFAKDIIRKAKDLCNKNYGNIPGQVVEQIDELLKREKAIVPWNKVLRMFVATCAESVLDHTVKRISRRFNTRPGTRKADVIDLAVAVDTSGCFVGETFIPMADGGFQRIDDVRKGDLVVSSVFGKGQVIRKCTNLFEKEAYELVEVKADKGFSFTCTPNHRVFIVQPSFNIRKMKKYDKHRRGKFYDALRSSPVIEKRADELTEGDLVVVANKTTELLNCQCGYLPKMSQSQSGMYVTQNDIDEADSLKKRGISYHRQHREGMMRFGYQAILSAKNKGLASHLAEIPVRTSEEFCQLMGYFIGDGHVDISTLSLTDEDEDRLVFYRYLTKKVFGLNGSITNWSRQRLTVHSKSLVRWIEDNFPSITERSRNRTIPEEWTRLPDNQVAALIRGLFDAEGFTGEHYVAFVNSSQQLIRQIHLILGRLGIESTINPTNLKDRILDGTLIKGGHFWRLSVYGSENLRAFADKVGFSCEQKKARLGGIISKFQKEQNNDSIDYTIGQKLVAVREVSRVTLEEPVLVYDLEIEGEHNYMANGVVVHNSISDEQLKLFFNEIRWIWKNGAKITVYEADCSIQAKYVFKGKFTGKVHGRGGTNLEPVLKEVERKYDALIYFTDFYAPKIAKPYKIPVLWILTTEYEKKDYPYPWGKHIKIEDGKAAVA